MLSGSASKPHLKRVSLVPVLVGSGAAALLQLGEYFHNYFSNWSRLIHDFVCEHLPVSINENLGTKSFMIGSSVSIFKSAFVATSCST